MSAVKAPLSLKLSNSLKGVTKAIKSPKYIFIALIVSFLVTGFIVWSLNFNLLKYIAFEAPVSLYEKIRLFWDVQTGIYSVYSSPQATGILLFGLLFGLNSALITYLIKNNGFKQIPKKSGGAGLVFAVLGGGCIACGTSILAPLLATIGATSSAFTTTLSNYFNWIGIILILYSIYKLGFVINNTIDQK